MGRSVAAGLSVLADPSFHFSKVDCNTGSTISVGHEYREDDVPAIAVAPDGSFWVAWLSFDGQRDDVAIRHYRSGVWENLLWVPGTSGDSWLPQVAVEASGRVWVIW